MLMLLPPTALTVIRIAFVHEHELLSYRHYYRLITYHACFVKIQLLLLASTHFLDVKVQLKCIVSVYSHLHLPSEIFIVAFRCLLLSLFIPNLISIMTKCQSYSHGNLTQQLISTIKWFVLNFGLLFLTSHCIIFKFLQ